MRNTIVMLAVGILLGVYGCAAQQGGPVETGKTAGVQPGEAAKDARLDWWREARFGMFIHWGLYAIPAGEWKGGTDHAEWIRESAHIPIEEYDKFVGQFNPVKFNADEWVRMAKDAGVKYIVITSKHHDGFCLFDSKYTDYDVMSTPFKRDIMKELADACRRQGLRICWYHSIMDWHHPDYLPRRSWETRSAEGADFSRYDAHLKNQVQELLTNYGDIGIMWFDGQWENTWNHQYGQDLYDFVRKLQPKTIVNNRVDKGGGGMSGKADTNFAGDYGTPEQEIPATGLPGVDWETCMTMNDHWGYNKNDKNFKSAETLIRMLVDIASKGGNYLLNVGPTAEGLIPPESVERLAAMGRWMKVNGEAIYGTSASPFANLAWGRCTQKRLPDGNTRLYLHVFDWPKDGKLAVPGIFNEPRQARLLAAAQGAPLAVSRQDDAIVVQLPGAAPDPIASVIALDIAGRPDIAKPPVITPAGGIFVGSTEVSLTTGRENVEIRYTVDGTEPAAASPVAKGPVKLTQTATLAARAFRAGKPVSPSAKQTFTKEVPRPAEKADGLLPGLNCECYEGEWSRMPQFDGLAAMKTGSTAAFDLSMRPHPENFGLRYTGFVKAPKDGVYTFALSSDDGSRLRIGDRLVVDNDGLHGMVERSGQIALAAGVHPITVEFFQRTGDVGLQVLWSGPGVEKQAIPKEALFHGPTPVRQSAKPQNPG